VRLQERFAERERIARDFHDTVFQGIHVLLLGVNAALDTVAPSDPAHTMLSVALKRAEQALSDGHDRIRWLQEPPNSQYAVHDSLAAFGSDLARCAGLEFRALVEGTVRGLDADVGCEIVSIGRECLVNAFRHARARSIKLHVSYAMHEFRMLVRDDGQGIDERMLLSGPVPGHLGLKGMRERASGIRGDFSLSTRPGTGTEIELRVPARIAYTQDNSRRRARQLLKARAVAAAEE
jgi:signal transduction histidine kinase